MTLDPAALTPADADKLRGHGLSDAAIEEAIEVAFLFNIIDRLADAFDFHLPTEENLVWTVRILKKMGYKGIAL